MRLAEVHDRRRRATTPSTRSARPMSPSTTVIASGKLGGHIGQGGTAARGELVRDDDVDVRILQQRVNEIAQRSRHRRSQRLS